MGLTGFVLRRILDVCSGGLTTPMTVALDLQDAYDAVQVSLPTE